MTDFFKGISPVKFEGPSSSNPLAFRHYNKDEIVLGKRMEDHLRFAVAYWHSFAWPGGDPFGGQTFDRPWFGDTMAATGQVPLRSVMPPTAANVVCSFSRRKWGADRVTVTKTDRVNPRARSSISAA